MLTMKWRFNIAASRKQVPSGTTKSPYVAVHSPETLRVLLAPVTRISAPFPKTFTRCAVTTTPETSGWRAASASCSHVDADTVLGRIAGGGRGGL